MAEPAIRNDEYLEMARALVAALEDGAVDRADDLLDSLSSMRKSKMFLELGKLTRTLHEALNHFQVDSRLARIANEDIPDAHHRLRFVVTKTEEAAHRTLKAVEDSIPLARRLETRALEHQRHWERFLRREMNVQEFRSMTQSLREFLASILDDAKGLSGHLTEVLMAQEYQDLTGQVIQRVIQIVQDVEHGLVEMLRVCGQRSGAVADEPKAAVRGHGPQIDPKTPDVVANQDEVDDLLSSLGF
jgi:chemotaxis protein CheZ